MWLFKKNRPCFSSDVIMQTRYPVALQSVYTITTLHFVAFSLCQTLSATVSGIGLMGQKSLVLLLYAFVLVTAGDVALTVNTGKQVLHIRRFISEQKGIQQFL